MSAATVRLWDPVVRLFHWSLAGAFLANYFFTEEGEDWHRWLGYYAVAWLAIRLVWGFVGTPAARWADFWPTPARLGAHLRALIGGQPYHRLGHSPLGALVMILMMGLMLGLGVTGFLMEEVDYFWARICRCKSTNSVPTASWQWSACISPPPCSRAIGCARTCRCRW